MNNSNTGLQPGGSGALGPGFDINALIAAVRQELSLDLPNAQIAAAVEKARMGCLPSARNLYDTFTATSAVSNPSFRLDGGFDFIVYAISAVAQSTDIDFVINNLNYNGNTNLFPDTLPVAMLKQWTAKPLDFFWYLPANATVNATITNGSTTAANKFAIILFGQRVPVGAVQQALIQYSNNGNG